MNMAELMHVSFVQGDLQHWLELRKSTEFNFDIYTFLAQDDVINKLGHTCQ